MLRWRWRYLVRPKNDLAGLVHDAMISDSFTYRRLNIKMNMTTSHQLNPYAIGLCTLGRWIAQKNWLPATGGNLSVRASQDSCLISRSGKDKGELSPQDLLNVSWADGDLHCSGTPSAETALHVALYQLFPACKTVLHTHSVSATVFSRLIRADGHPFAGYEMQKAIEGCHSHEQLLDLAIFDNTQQIPQLAAQVRQRAGELNFAFLVRGHGLYVWGDSLEQARRHLEGWEFLIACELERLKIEGLI